MQEVSIKEILSSKKFYKRIEPKGFRFYCVSCKRERRLAPPARVGSLKFFGQVLLSTLALSAITYPWLHFKGIFAWLVPVGLTLEVVYRLRMRKALICPDCEFDPILYMSDRKAAAQQVEEAWKRKFEKAGIPFPEKKKSSLARSVLDGASTSNVNQGHGNQ
jgi:hypothetical protein